MDDLSRIAMQVEEQEGYIRYVINDDIYMLKLLPSIVAWDLAEDIAEFIFPIIGSMIDGEEGFGEDQWLNIGLIISKNLKELKIADKAKLLLKDATKNGKSINIMTDFLGAKGLVVLTELTEKALKENVLDFLFLLLERKGLSIHSINSIKQLQDQILKESKA